MSELAKRVFLRVNWRLSVATVGWLSSEFGLVPMNLADRHALSAACFLVIVGSIASWQNRIGRHVPRTPREEPKE